MRLGPVEADRLMFGTRGKRLPSHACTPAHGKPA
jgi:hypothetical protein